MDDIMWEEIENRLRGIEERQHERDGKCDDVRGDFARWLLGEFFKARPDHDDGHFNSEGTYGR